LAWTTITASIIVGLREPFFYYISTVVFFGPFKNVSRNEKDSSTFDLTVRPLSGAVPAGLFLNSDGGAKVKTS
jgi:hypothetical protein